jgi:DNA-binding transcriptional regulator of glucitol operon
MEAARMKLTVTLVAALLISAGAQAGDVYVTKDAKGNTVYTDTPQTLPAEKVGISSSSTDPAVVQKRYADTMSQYAKDDAQETKATASTADSAKASAMTAEDKAKRCTDARQRYQTTMDARRLYEQDPNGERRYLDSPEIDAARANAKKLMDEFCSGQ